MDGICRNMKAKLQEKEILTVKDLMSKTQYDLVQILEAPMWVVKELINSVAQFASPQPMTVRVQIGVGFVISL